MFKRDTAARKKYARTPIDGGMAAIFKDGLQKGIKLPILNVQIGVVDASDTSLITPDLFSFFGTHIRFGS